MHTRGGTVESGSDNTIAETTACRGCGSPLVHTFVDLGMSPLCESFLPADRLDEAEMFYPLRVMVCDRCWLVQLREYVSPEHIFDDYAYYSSYSTAWLEHAREYVDAVIPRLGLTADSLAVELASNDGYLLKNFVERNIPSLGIEPAANVAEAAEAVGVETLVEFFDDTLAHTLVEQGKRADLIIGNNVLAQVPDLNTFVAGMRTLLKPGGTITLEFPHLARLMSENQFDTIYHEHFSYFSLIACEHIFAEHGLVIYDVEELWTHGGSLRLWVRHVEHTKLSVTDAVAELREREHTLGLDTLDAYRLFDAQVRRTKRRLLEFLIAAADRGETVVGYGAPGKGKHAAELLRHPRGPARVHRRPQPLQTRPLPPGHAHPRPPRLGPRRGETRLGADPPVEPQAGDHEADESHRRVGRAICGSHSGTDGI